MGLFATLACVKDLGATGEEHVDRMVTASGRLDELTDKARKLIDTRKCSQALVELYHAARTSGATEAHENATGERPGGWAAAQPQRMGKLKTTVSRFDKECVRAAPPESPADDDPASKRFALLELDGPDYQGADDDEDDEDDEGHDEHNAEPEYGGLYAPGEAPSTGMMVGVGAAAVAAVGGMFLLLRRLG